MTDRRASASPRAASHPFKEVAQGPPGHAPGLSRPIARALGRGIAPEAQPWHRQPDPHGPPRPGFSGPCETVSRTQPRHTPPTQSPGRPRSYRNPGRRLTPPGNAATHSLRRPTSLISRRGAPASSVRRFSHPFKEVAQGPRGTLRVRPAPTLARSSRALLRRRSRGTGSRIRTDLRAQASPVRAKPSPARSHGTPLLRKARAVRAHIGTRAVALRLPAMRQRIASGGRHPSSVVAAHPPARCAGSPTLSRKSLKALRGTLRVRPALHHPEAR